MEENLQTAKVRRLVVGCYLLWNGRILYLRKQPDHATYPHLWGHIVGKVEKDRGEGLVEAMCREIEEECGLAVDAGKLIRLGSHDLTHQKSDGSDFDFRVTTFCYHYPDTLSEPAIKLSPEHEEFCWKYPDEALASLETIPDEDKTLRLLQDYLK